RRHTRFSRDWSSDVCSSDLETIGRFISFIGAHGAFLAMEEVRVFKEMRNEVNRLVNCETANLEKSVRAGLEQVEVIKALKAWNRSEERRVGRECVGQWSASA